MKFYKFNITCLVLLLLTGFLQAQNRNSVWCFGDSAGIDFSSGAAFSNSSGMDGRGSCASIADTNGSILFYAFTRATISGNTGLVINKQHQLMDNGDDILGQGWYNEIVILPSPGNINQYYLFSIGVTNSTNYGLYYSIIDITLNGGLGSVIQKNVLLENSPSVDCLKAVKHGNGRDWWIIWRKYDPNFLIGSKRYYKFLLTPSGVSLYNSQAIGSTNTTNSGQIAFNDDGTKMAFVNLRGMINVMKFNRCSGQLFQINVIQEESNDPDSMSYLSCEFSPNSNNLYVIKHANTSYLLQYDLTSSNPSSSRDTIHEFMDSQFSGGYLKRAPDNNIYLSNAWYNGFQFNYPYPDSVYNYVNMNLSVINDPDQLGSACNFQPYSFYLGGKRTYWGLPNNPDYDLSPLVGSPCDTLVSQNELAGAAAVGSLHVYYHKAWDKVFINAEHLKGKVGKLLLYNLQGQLVYEEPLKIQNGYYTKDLSMIGKSNGMYLVVVQTEKERMVKKLVI